MDRCGGRGRRGDVCVGCEEGAGMQGSPPGQEAPQGLLGTPCTLPIGARVVPLRAVAGRERPQCPPVRRPRAGLGQGGGQQPGRPVPSQVSTHTGSWVRPAARAGPGWPGSPEAVFRPPKRPGTLAPRVGNAQSRKQAFCVIPSWASAFPLNHHHRRDGQRSTRTLLGQATFPPHSL